MKTAMMSFCLCLFMSLLLPVSLSAAEEGQDSTALTVSAQAFDADELAALQLEAHKAQEVAQQVGGADEKFWKAAAIGAGVVILIIIIF